MSDERAGHATEGPQKPAMEGQVINNKSNIRIHDDPITMQVHEAYQGATSVIHIGSEYTIQIQVTNGDSARATARAELNEEKMRELYEAIGEALDR